MRAAHTLKRVLRKQRGIYALRITHTPRMRINHCPRRRKVHILRQLDASLAIIKSNRPAPGYFRIVMCPSCCSCGLLRDCYCCLGTVFVVALYLNCCFISGLFVCHKNCESPLGEAHVFIWLVGVSAVCCVCH